MTRSLAAACALAFALTIAYAAYLQPEWEPTRDDQFEYLALARGLALRGEYTRAAPGQPFYPEWLRAPGYPLALAPLCATAGCGHWQVAIAQALLASVLVALSYRLARRYLERPRAIAAAWLTAAYPLFAYLAALPLSDLLAATLFVALLDRVLAVRAGAGPAAAAVCGLLCGALAVTRPAFIPFVLVAAGLALPRAREALAVVAVAAAIIAPWAAYSQAHLGRPLPGNSGAVLWIGYFQGKAVGLPADHDAFRAAALAARDPAAVAQAGARLGLDAVESTEASAAIREIETFESSADRLAQSRSYGALNDSLSARALRLIAHDPAGWVARGLGTRTLELVAHDEPYRVRDAAAVPSVLRLLAVVTQLLLLALAFAGLLVVARRRPGPALVAAVAIGYVWLSAVPFQTEARYALPARPLLLTLVVAGSAVLPPFRAPGLRRPRGSRR